ncbi:hypothetical protein CEUSTIGMA_g11418.t1 [Chlamydomonas eustigma]|uniref:EIPR1-like beta-propeller domain-containing protein n=1 Tax=Chlamydomonas eustigma TaxID=1157962 RepID=A0A250XLT3_9CHLO|nr:hypothetical protein CEUSTIGMA_g11418.t1 [Chlamydomonas eustigma]|eukprot:GAX83993.1 hypothetical protein CEUSTIGMA_g11418.t1 [Chlamydomonas eustigma]
MTDQGGITYSLKFQARALAHHQGDRVNSKWVVGTNALREENEIRVLQYDPDQERLLSVAAYHHPPEIWSITSSASSEDLFLTVWSKAGVYGVSLWRAHSNSSLIQEAELDGHTTTVRSALWHSQQQNLALTVEEGGIRSWDINASMVKSSGFASSGELLQLWSGMLHPHNPSVAVTAGGQNLQLWDLRSMSMTSQTSTAHRMPTRDVCFASHDEYRVVSGGDDCKLCFWDTRMLGRNEAVLVLGGHSHWVWKAQFNPFYDQLIASSSSDSLVNLFHTPHLNSTATATAAAAPAGDLGSGTQSKATASRSGDVDGKVHTYDEHEDSVYGLAWSAADPWLFATLSYDGRVVINKVPKSVKYKVLL